ncbi:MAG: helix-turn-helix transcriptional regulator [Ruminococcus sp.]|nr:helix-turn-helix transcriptional regulator [Ruminococcus sp.]
MNFGEKIKNAREDLDISQTEIAKLIPMNQSNYSKIERGVQEPNLLQLKRICEILKLDPAYLLDLKHSQSIGIKDAELLADIKALISKHK